MRPIVMDMHGFASFREQTRVDFTDADFFALVGPTGAGKSTVIDAMTFALYGSVPRWGRKGMVSLALAPAVTRATVKLVFEADRQRYVIARELRRIGSQVSQRAASLERLLDRSGLASAGDETVPMAKDLAGVNEAVEGLLGLSYEDFIQCVVLPQGQFADFLHAKPADRQQILVRLLGAEHYKQMMMKANQRAGAAAQRAETIGESLLAFADATEESAERSRAAQAALAALDGRVAQILPRIGERQAALSAAESRLGRLNDEHAALVALRVPDDIAALDANLRASRADLERLKVGEQEAERADNDARAALAAGPRRAPLDLARERRGERNQLQDRIPGLRTEVTRLEARAEAAAAAVDTASATLESLRSQRDKAAQDATAAAEAVTRLEREHTAFAAVSAPAGVAALDERRQAAAAAEAAAARTVADAEEAEVTARAARDRAVPESPLAHVSRDLSDLKDLRASLGTARHAAEQASHTRTAADTELAQAEDALRQQRETLEEAKSAHVIAGLRPHLVAGEACPLCEQTVTTLPAPVAAPEVDDAQARLLAAERAVDKARGAVTTAMRAAERADADLRSKSEHGTRLVNSLSSALNGPLSGVAFPALQSIVATEDPAVESDELVGRASTEVAALLADRSRLDQAATAAAKAVAAGRVRLKAAQEAAKRTEFDLAGARNALRAARDPLVHLGAPQISDADLVAGWAILTEWATRQARTRAAELVAARESERELVAKREGAKTEFTHAERSLAALRADANMAITDDQRAKAKLGQDTKRVAELGELLRGAPSDGQITEQLDLLAQLERAMATAETTLRAARAARAQAGNALAALERDESTARTRLSSARDNVVSLGAPALDGLGPRDAWTRLVTWAADQATSRERQIATESAEVASVRASLAQLTGRLSADLAEVGIELAPDIVATAAASAVATALERARAAITRIEERRAEAADLRGRQEAAQEEQQVAALLGDLLRADHFQRWLVNAAVDGLVTEASATLSALSSGQFDLVYDDGDFYVIDHADADARRSVRTLSGGETFQASLALALALSSQITALAAAGAARLDSIFLDEGFGTLDSETLDVVASTLETLAQGDRMVGVVTHVAALAERVPVRFRVTRNARTSTITREGLAISADDEVMG